VIGPLLFYLGGGGVGPPTPMLLMFTMTTIIATMWLVSVWSCWPVSMLTSIVPRWSRHIGRCLRGRVPGVQPAVDFSFLAHTPLYVASLDPKGRLDAWVAAVIPW